MSKYWKFNPSNKNEKKKPNKKNKAKYSLKIMQSQLKEQI